MKELIEEHARRAVLPVQHQNDSYQPTPYEANAIKNMRHILTQFAEALYLTPSPREGSQASYQQRVRAWVLECFGTVIADDMTERSFRFLEEAMELSQSVGCTREQAHALVDYVFGRPAGELGQEVGGVMVTLAALVSAAGVNLNAQAERELTRINTPETIAKIRRKQASKRGVVSHAAQAALPGEWSESTSGREGSQEP